MLLGGENDDLIQEGMIGLFKAIQDFKSGLWKSFFRICGALCRKADVFCY